MRARCPERRAVPVAGLSALVGGCATRADLKPLPASEPRLRIGDAHAHFFNAADLPVVGSLREILIRLMSPNGGRSPSPPLDIAATF